MPAIETAALRRPSATRRLDLTRASQTCERSGVAKPTRSIPVCDGLTLEGADLVFAGRRSPILECARAAFDRAVPGSDIERELGHALGLHVNDKGQWVNNTALAFPGGLGAAGWAAVLACDPGLADALRADDARAAGLVVVNALTRAAGPCPDPLAMVLAVAEAARATVTGKAAPHHARQLIVPHAVEVACWRPARSVDQGGRAYATGGFVDPDPAALADRLARLQAVREREFRRAHYRPQPVVPTGDVLPAVRLTGGVAGRVVLRPASDSTLAWATATWRACRAALAGPRPAAKPKSTAAKAEELPVVALIDGVVVGHGTMSAADLAALIRDAATGRAHGLTEGELVATQDDQVCPHCEHVGTVADEPCVACNISTPAASKGRAALADAFMAAATRRRDEAERLPGEQRYLREIADGWKVDLEPVQTALARQLAAELLTGEPGAPRFVAVRDAVRAVKMPRLPSVSQHVEAWARALADLAAREEAEAADAREGAILDALERETPGALGALLRCGEIADPWGALVALTAADAEAAAVRENLTRPAMIKRLLALQTRATQSLGSAVRPHLRHEVETLVAVLRDERADCEAFLVPTFAEARRALLTCCGTAVAVCQGHRPESWRVLSGSLLTLVRAGLGELQEREGVVTAEWCPPGLPIGDLTDALLEWAVQEWQAAGCDGPPPSMLDALIHNEAANARSVTARNNKRR